MDNILIMLTIIAVTLVFIQFRLNQINKTQKHISESLAGIAKHLEGINRNLTSDDKTKPNE